MFQLLSDYDTDSDVKNFLDNYDWVFVPVFNPDGYVHSHEVRGTEVLIWSVTLTEGIRSSLNTWNLTLWYTCTVHVCKSLFDFNQ